MADKAVELHFLPELHGNWSSFAATRVRAIISGMALGHDDDLVKLYLATLQGIALGTLFIITRMESHRIGVNVIVLTGG